MQPTFSGVLKKSGNSTYILIPANILDIAGINPETALFSATVDHGSESNVIEMVVKIWTKPTLATKKAIEDAPTA